MGGMQPVTPIELLNFWERSMDHTMIRRAVDSLCCASPGANEQEIAGLCIGERDARLLLLREWLFGQRLQNMAQCPFCSERIEWEMDIQDIQLQVPNFGIPPENYLLEAEEYSILFRLPNGNDLEAAMDAKKRTKPENLLTRLILDCKFKNEPCKMNDLPGKILEILDQRIEEMNPQADIRMGLRCANCEHQWEVQFDIVSYLWIEINGWARHILQDIGTLARAYGWSEQNILNMSAARRQIYLDMVNL